MIGSRLAHYQITAHLGSGGMGEVYQATDTKLGRSVAIKVLPEAFARDAERISRFEREARLLASLNHPHIAAIYGLEESGGRNLLVMELAAGETLAERIARGPIAVDEALAIAKQIAEALEAAHEKGIMHRDLKPANIKVTADGQVKVLDFGLAKAFEGEAANANVSNSPTLSLAATNAGMILGTAAYMSPEQARGMPVDRRTDIFAFGAVLYEMLTGRQAFRGDTVSDILASVLKLEPDWTRLPQDTPAGIRRLLRRCLQKDRNRRLKEAADVRIEIEEAGAEAESTAVGTPLASRTGKRLWMMVAAVLLIALAALAVVHFRETLSAQQSLRFQIEPPGAAAAQFPTMAPDGRYLAFVANNGGPNQVWVHAMDTLESRALAGTDEATYPFWSPDGANIGFFAQGKLKKIAIAGGPPQTLCDATSGRGGTWNRDGVILFSAGPASPLFRVPAAGGIPTPITKVIGGDLAAGHRFPAFLPDGIHFFYNAGSDKPDDAGIFIGSLDGTAAVRVLPDVSNALYAPPTAPGGAAYLLFRREDTLMALPFDSKALTATGDIFPVAEHVPNSGNNGFGAFSVSENGMLVYRTQGVTANRQLVWMDRGGKRLGLVGKPGAVGGFTISPDEKTVASWINVGSQTDIWLQDMGRDVMTRFTFRSGFSAYPVWSPDGTRLIFGFRATGVYSLDFFQKAAAGNAGEELLLHGGINADPNDWSPDGKWIAYQQDSGKTGTDLWLLPGPPGSRGSSADSKPMSYLQTPFNELSARFSPDGKWIAYQSNESGQNQVYVQAVPASGGKWQISTSGGVAPQWRRDGKEIFYISADQKLVAVPIKLSAVVEPGTPQLLFPFPSVATVLLLSFNYAPSHDGQRFLVNAPAGGESAAAPPVTVITNWQPALKK